MTKAGLLVRRLTAVTMLAWSAAATTAQPFADVHVHFNWDQRELIDAGRVAAKLAAAGVEFAEIGRAHV